MMIPNFFKTLFVSGLMILFIWLLFFKNGPHFYKIFYISIL